MSCNWKIEGPRMRPQDEVHVYAYLGGRMIGMLDCRLYGGGVQLRMAYVSPPWRGSAVLRDMLAALRRHYRRVAVSRPRRHGAMGK
ncbi:hypothetical protein [Herbaspirillum sp. SJZ099]|uniref:hypothetical protein n=1 Tax=Herbaspirillum sp. SJZ099 TaxID=2572916 RepID=UPI00210779E7|nr:hypothetical protein [Herbaspirillum sp. SJZ099]